MHWRRISALARLETLRLLLDRTSVGLILIVPAVQLVLFGYAVNLTPANIPVAIASSCDRHEDLLRHAIGAAQSLRLITQDPHVLDARQYITTRRALVVVDCPSEGPPQIIADASDSSAVRPAVAELGRTVLEDVLRSAFAGEPSALNVQWLYNPDGRTAWFLAPGLIGVIVMITMLLLGALTLVREREQGSWEGLLSTPITAADALIGKLVPYVLVAVAQTILVLALARVLFELPMLGNGWTLVLASSVLALAHLTLGFAISALAGSQMQAIQAAVFFYLPSMLLSGFMFPFEGMPRWAQLLGNALPLTHFVRSARGVLLKGYGTHEVMSEMWPAAVFAAVAALATLAVFRRRID
jgi:ABC-2 type transport system permease protein